MSPVLPIAASCLLLAMWPQADLVAQNRPLPVECKALLNAGYPDCGDGPAPPPDGDPDPDLGPGPGNGGQAPIDRGCEVIAGAPINHNVSWPQVWQALNDRGGCTTSCHTGTAPAADLDFSSRDLAIYYLVSQQSTQGSALRVVAGNARDSLFYQKISCAIPAIGQPMPPPAGHLPIDVQGLVFDWIEQGAYGESSEDPIPRLFVFKDSLETVR